MIWRAIIGGLWKPLAWLFGAAALWLAGTRSNAVRAEKRGLQSEVGAHERINEADLGIGASDADNQRWLRDFHDKHSK